MPEVTPRRVKPEILRPDASLETMPSPANMSPAEIQAAIKTLAADRGIRPETVFRFLDVPQEKLEADLLTEFSKVLFALYAVIHVLGRVVPEMPVIDSYTVPAELMKLLDAVHTLQPFADLSAVDTGLREQLAAVSFEIAFVAGLVDIVGFRRRDRGMNTQKRTRELVEKGEMRYEMNPGHLAMFVGNDQLTTEVIEHAYDDGDVQFYGNEAQGLRAWQAIRIGDKRKMYQAFERGDLKHAGAASIIALPDTELFLSNIDDEAMDFDSVFGLVELLDDWSDDQRLPHLPIVIIGNRYVEESYHLRGRKTGNAQPDEERFRYTFETRVDQVNRERQSRNAEQIHFIDPTDLVLHRIQSIIGDRQFLFFGSEATMKKYGDRFRKDVKARNMQEQHAFDKEGDPYIVHYGMSDIELTQSHSVVDPQNEIVILRDMDYYDSVVRRGVPAEQIIIVSQLLHDVIAEYQTSE